MSTCALFSEKSHIQLLVLMDTNAADITRELYQRIAKGDERAFKVVYERHWRKLYRFLYRMTKTREVAEELMMDVFLKLWIGRELVPEIRNMDGFLYQVAYRKALDFLKLAGRESSLQKVIGVHLIDKAAAQTAQPDQYLMEEEYRRILEMAIFQLSPQRRKVFMLSREEGMTHNEIAQELHLSPKTVKRTLSDALASIRRYLEKNPHTCILLWAFFLI